MPSSSVTIRVPACAPCCGVQAVECTAPTVGSVTCVSRTGSGLLRGWSKYQNHNAGDWNQRKFTRVDFSLSPDPWEESSRFTDCAEGEEGCTGCLNRCGPEYVYTIVDGVGAWNVVTNSQTNSATKNQILCGGSEFPVSFSGIHSNLFSSPNSSSGPTSDLTHATVYTGGGTNCTGRVPEEGCCGSDDIGAGGSGIPATVVATLSLPDTISAAQARGAPSVGSLCKTVAGTISSTSATSTTQISISSGTTSVQATIPLSGLVIGESYELVLLINRYTAGGGAFVDQITVTVGFTAEATSENYVYDVPVNTDFDYEFDSVDEARCAAA